MDTDRRNIWDGVYSSFAEARGDSGVFEQDIWLDKVTGRARALLSLSEGPDSIAPIAETREYFLPVIAAMAARPGETLRVLDFGGGLASSYIPLAGMLPANQELKFVIVENESVCKAGREMFADDARAEFCAEIPDASEKFDIVHCGSSLHYVDDWKAVLARLCAFKPNYFVLADLPAADNKTFVTAQLYHGARIPVRFWNLGEFIAQVESLDYHLVFKSRYRGSYLGEKEGPSTENFDTPYRLRYFSQLVFIANES